MRIHTPILGATLAAAVAMASTGAAQPVPSVPPPTGSSAHPCPAYVRGAKLSVRDIDGGVAFEITTGTAAYVEDLRQMLRELASIVEHHARALAADPHPAENAVPIPPVDIVVKDIPQGVVVTVRARQVTNVGLVRHQAHGVEKLWERSRCVNPRGAPPAVGSIPL